MNRNVTAIWNIAQGLLALAICYVLIFEDGQSKLFWALLAVFFISLALRNRKRLSGK